MVRLERRCWLIIAYMTMFQFQYGAIRTAMMYDGNTLGSLFQFQYGAIRTNDALSELYDELVSIPVWCD